MSRSGRREEILRGPLFYGFAFVALTIIFWKDNPIGIVALMLLCGGDGLADIVGNQVGTVKIPWSKKKSWAGTAAVFAGGLVLSVVILAVFDAAGVIPFNIPEKIGALVIIALAGALVESLPFSDIDNLTVPLVAIALGYIFFW
jgi:phytol kinase